MPMPIASPPVRDGLPAIMVENSFGICQQRSRNIKEEHITAIAEIPGTAEVFSALAVASH